MGFIEDILKSFGEDFTYGKGINCTLTANAGYFENVSGVVKYTSEEIVLSFKGGLITISGKNLAIKKYCEGDVAVCGQITALKKE